MENKTERVDIRMTKGQIELLKKMTKSFYGTKKGARTDTILFALSFLYNNIYKTDEEQILSFFDL